MAYATVDELAAALRLTVTPANTAALQRCLDAAAREIDATIDLPAGSTWTPLGGDLALIKSANIRRGVEWWKANDAARDVIVSPPPGQGKKTAVAHATADLLPLKQQWGVG